MQFFPCLLIPTQVTVPGSRPPTESLQQVRACNFLQQVVRERERTCCFFDGNKAWAGESKRLGIQYRQVSHQNHEYAKEVTTTARGLSNVGGTQNMDRWWLSLKHYIPSSLNRKHKKGDDATLHEHVSLEVFQWAWRNHAVFGKNPSEVLEQLSRLFAQ